MIEAETLIIPRGMPGASQAVELCVGSDGEIEAVMLPFAGRTDDGAGFCGGTHFFSAGLLVADRDRVVPAFGVDWGRMVVCTREFARRHRIARTASAPAPQLRIFFARG